jgi:hypothetical protein
LEMVIEVKRFLSHLIEASNLLKVAESVSNEMLKKNSYKPHYILSY